MNNRPFHLVILLLVFAALITTAAAPSPVRGNVAARAEVVRLTVENRSSGSLYVWLTGPTVYYFEIKSGETEVFAISRGEYTYRFRACGDTVDGTLDMSTQRKLVMPVCGGRATSEAKAAGTVDISSQIKIVKVSIENDASTRALVIMTGPTTYVFTFERGEEKDYTIAKGDYKVQTFACGRVGTRNFTAYKGKTLVLACPSP
jgi:hypothetical protein